MQGRRMRVDTTVVETNIHYPTDASLLGDGVRVLTRTMKKIARLSAAAGAKLRDRMRSTQRCLVHIGRASHSFRTDQGKERLRQCYGRLLAITGRAVGQAKRFVREVQDGIKAGTRVITQAAIEAHSAYLKTMIPRCSRPCAKPGNAYSRATLVRPASSSACSSPKRRSSDHPQGQGLQAHRIRQASTPVRAALPRHDPSTHQVRIDAVGHSHRS